MKYICAKLKQLCNTMKPYTAGIHTILIVLLTLFCAYLEYKLRVTKDSLSWVISSMNPEERISYDSQQFKNPYDLSTIFTFMGVIFGLFSFLTFQSVKDFFASKIKDVEDKHEEAKKEYESEKHRLEDLMSEFYSSETFRNLEYMNRDFRSGQHSWVIYYLFCALSYFGKKCELAYKNKKSESYIQEMIDFAIKKLDEAIVDLKNENNLKNVDDFLINAYIRDIRKFNSTEIDSKVIILYLKLSIEKEDY